MKVKHFFDKETYTLTYIVYKEGFHSAIVIDPVWNLDLPSGKIQDRSILEIKEFLENNNLTPVLSLETHAHADHLSGSYRLKNYFPGIYTAISSRIKAVQSTFGSIFNMEKGFDKNSFDYLLDDHKTYSFDPFNIKILPTKGHTPACTSFLIENALFTGDSLFMPDFGTGRCDFPDGSALDLFNSVKNIIYSLPDDTDIYVGHDYQPGGRELLYMSTVKEQKEQNIHINQDTKLSEFIKMRESRDAILSAPKLLFPSIQVNITGGTLPFSEANGKKYLKIPLDNSSL